MVYELDEDRGRPHGDTANVLVEGARAAGCEVELVMDQREALREGLRRCEAGDTLVYACATQLDDVRAAFGELDLAEERVAPHGLRLAWSATPPGAGARDDSPLWHGMRRASAPRWHGPA